MKKSTFRMSVAVVAVVLCALAAQAAQFGAPKREFRSAWVATVWALDWPMITGSDAYTGQRQQEQLIRMLDSLKNNNFNAVNFQVRSMCDAMYKSSYEPWSSYLTGTRGKAPAYDPLEFVVAECHKRGMECHAWVNPYRFTTSTNWDTEQDRELKNNGWLIHSGDTRILDPGQQRTIDRIVNVCREIIENYDVDGVLYDDYFYPSGITSDSSADDYQEWVDSGTTLSLGDWRRDNVNRMVRAVYDMIQATRPEVRFGISPAGVAASSSSVAAKYGVDPCPGSDWQYNGIFSDPLAWYADQSIDYMSPQVYWHIGRSGADYGLITPWWNKVAKKFGRHMFVSHSISELSSNSQGSANPEPSMTYQSGFIYDEFANEVELMRTTNEDGAMVSIYYSCKYLYRMSAPECLAQYLKRTVYTRPALPPAMTWKPEADLGPVQNLDYSDGVLTWEDYGGTYGRYTVYAFPETMSHDNFACNGEYLLGITYSPEYTLPEHLREGYHYAVCVFDRYGYEYEPAIFGDVYETLPAPELESPTNGVEVFAPLTFSWHPVEGAAAYVVEVATEPDFGKVLARVTTNETSLPSTGMTMESGVKHYWRVQSTAPQHTNGVSAVAEFTPTLLLITAPANGSKLLERPVTVTWNKPNDKTEATLRVATDEDMTQVVYTTQSATGEAVVPADALNPGTRYYLDVTMEYAGLTLISPVTTFTTQFATPAFLLPVDGGPLYADDHITVQPQSEAVSYTIEVSASATSWGRTRYLETVTEGNQTTKRADEIKVSSKLLQVGTTYYARTRINYKSETGTNLYTDYSPVISFIYQGERPATLPGDVDGSGVIDIDDVNILINIILGKDSDELHRTRADIDGTGVVDVDDLNLIINAILRG